MHLRYITTILVPTLVTSIMLLARAFYTPAWATDIESAVQRGERKITFEVAENATRFAFDEAPIDDNGFPLYGNSFITQGFIYPEGTLEVLSQSLVRSFLQP